MIVVDTNVITYLVLNGDYTELSGGLFLWDAEWSAPRLWRDEMANILTTYRRNNLMDHHSAVKAFEHADRILRRNEYSIPVEKILEVAERTQCSGYDSQFISLAEDLGLKLFTFDKQILRAVPGIAHRPGEQEHL